MVVSLLTRPTPLSISQPSSCLSSFSPSSTSATSSSWSSTRRSWKSCATPPTTGVRAPATSSTSPTVLKETIAVSVTISISVQKQHSRILFLVLLRGRMREMRREPEVPEAKVPVEECFDCPARITSKEIAPIHSVKKWHPPECLFYKTKSGCRFGEKSRMHIVRLMNNLAKKVSKE